MTVQQLIEQLEAFPEDRRDEQVFVLFNGMLREIAFVKEDVAIFATGCTPIPPYYCVIRLLAE